MTSVLAILVDALRYDYVNENDTPFIHTLAQQGIKLPLKPILGYSDAIRATIFTGTYPDRHGYWMSYCYSPETSPFRGLKWLSFMDYIPSDLIRRGIKFLLSSTLMKILARFFGYSGLPLHNIPFRIMGRFDMTLRRQMIDVNAFPGFPTIFDVLMAHRMKFAYLDSSRLKRRFLHEIRRLRDDTKLVFVYLHYLDEAAHRFGLGSSRFKRSMRAVDATVAQVVSMLKGKFGNSLAVILFSDHGMAEEKNGVDLGWLTRIDGFGEDFVLSLDATMVRVWYEKEDTRHSLRRLISAAGQCRLLSDRERKEMGVAFEDRLYGDDVFLFDEGQIIFPNFYSYIRPRAMHAYDPRHPKQHGIFILRGCNGDVGIQSSVELVDIMPAVLSLLGLPVPSSCEGKSILRPRRDFG